MHKGGENSPPLKVSREEVSKLSILVLGWHRVIIILSFLGHPSFHVLIFTLCSLGISFLVFGLILHLFAIFVIVFSNRLVGWLIELSLSMLEWRVRVETV